LRDIYSLEVGKFMYKRSRTVLHKTEVAGVTFSDSDSVPVPKFLNQGTSKFQIWESDCCSDSGYNHRSNHNLPMFSHKKWPHRLLLLPQLKSDSGYGFS